MALRVRNLASGSSGNATLIEARGGGHTTRVLVDCGLRITELSRRLQSCGLALEDLDGLFITHEHSDHASHAASLVARLPLKVWMSEGTRRACEANTWSWRSKQLTVVRDGDALPLAELSLFPFTVPHDAREPLQLRCTDGDRVLGIVTDLGHPSRHVQQSLQGCHALLIEANHDPDMLQRSRYPAFLKQRIRGELGHLSNAQAAELLGAVLHPGLHTVIASHLSERNNLPQHAQSALAGVLGCSAEDVMVADPSEGTDWIEV
jgi:phosphoribosyl 1,2-cyclic phosphodiesterase